MHLFQVSLMGQLAETYGFYPVLRGDSDAALKTVPNEGGESLLVGDSTEAWIFHILRQDPAKKPSLYNRKPVPLLSSKRSSNTLQRWWSRRDLVRSEGGRRRVRCCGQHDGHQECGLD
jgi:hypothetical protein